MKDFKPYSSDSRAGIYLGITGVVLSTIGVFLSVYTSSIGEKSIWLGISGWASALFVGITLTILLWKLMTELSKAYAAYSELLLKVNDLQSANSKMIEINAYVISKTIRQQATKRERKVTEPQLTNSTDAAHEPTEEA